MIDKLLLGDVSLEKIQKLGAKGVRIEILPRRAKDSRLILITGAARSERLGAALLMSKKWEEECVHTLYVHDCQVLALEELARWIPADAEAVMWDMVTYGKIHLTPVDGVERLLDISRKNVAVLWDRGIVKRDWLMIDEACEGDIYMLNGDVGIADSFVAWNLGIHSGC